MTAPDTDRKAGAERRRLRSDARLNRERVLSAAAAAVLREGSRVPMATIAADAGVGVGTLYRRYSTREALLDALTRRSFEVVLANVRAAELAGTTGLDTIDRFFDATIARHGELVLPLHGGPPVATAATLAVQAEVHATVDRILDRGRRDGTVGPGITTADIIIFGAMLAEPLPTTAAWPTTASRIKDTYLQGVRPSPP